MLVSYTRGGWVAGESPFTIIKIILSLKTFRENSIVMLRENQLRHMRIGTEFRKSSTLQKKVKCWTSSESTTNGGKSGGISTHKNQLCEVEVKISFSSRFQIFLQQVYFCFVRQQLQVTCYYFDLRSHNFIFNFHTSSFPLNLIVIDDIYCSIHRRFYCRRGGCRALIVFNSKLSSSWSAQWWSQTRWWALSAQ